MAIPTFVDFSYASTNSVGTTVTCNYPAGSASGDLLVMFAGFRRTSASAFTLATPSGWNLLGTQNQSATYNHYSAVYWRFRGAETSVSVVASLGTSMYGSVQIHAYNGDVDPTTPINASFVKEQGSPTNSSADRLTPAVTTTSVDCAVSLFGITNFIFSGRGFDWPGATELNSVHSGSNGDLYFTSAITTQPTAGSTGTYIMRPTGGAIDEVHSATVAIQPSQFVTVNPTDVGAGTDAASVIANTPGADSGANTGEAAQIRVAATESGSGAAQVASVTATTPAADSGTRTESAAVTANTPGTDAGAGSESAFVTATRPATDTGSDAESATIRVYAADTGAFTETAAGIGQETGAFGENARITVVSSDSFTGTDSAYSANGVVTGDTNTTSEAAQIRISVTDVRTSSESAFVTATRPAAETGTATDAGRVIVYASDGGQATEAATIRVRASDSGAGTDNQTLIVTIFANDGGTATETTRTIVTAADSGHANEFQFRLISGLLIFPRQVKIPDDDRHIMVEPEPRRISIDPDWRTTNIRREIRRTIAVPADSRGYRIDAEG